jgi:hypothetical protein
MEFCFLLAQDSSLRICELAITRRRVDLTCLCVYLTHCCCRFFWCLLFFVVFLVFVRTFVGVLLFLFCGLNYCLPTHLKSDLLVETFVTGFLSSSTNCLWFFAVFLQQQPFLGGCCLYWLGLFIESFRHFKPPCVALEGRKVLACLWFFLNYR